MVFFVSCQKEQTVDEKDLSKGLILSPEEDGEGSGEGHEELDSTEFVYAEPNSDPIDDACVTYWQNMLYFLDINCFADFYNSIINKDDDDLDLWETTIGHYSIYSYYANLMNDPQVDDLDLDDERLPSPTYERVWNTDYKLRIGNTIYILNLDSSYITYLDSFSNPSVIADTVIAYASASKTFDCFADRRGIKRVFYPHADLKYTSQKYFKSDNFISQIGITFSSSRKNVWGNFKKRRVTKHCLLDRWHELRFEIWNEYHMLSSYVITDQEIKSSKNKEFDYIFSMAVYKHTKQTWNADENRWEWSIVHVGERLKLCENDFERIHSWTFNWLIDLHNDHYPN